MSVNKLKRSQFKQRIIYSVCLLALACSFRQSAPLYAYCECDGQEEQYHRAAIAVAGVTVVGLVAGMGCLAFGTRHHHRSSHHHHHGSYYSYSYSDYSYSDYSSNSYSYSSDYSRSSNRSSDYSDYPFSDDSVFSTTENTLSGLFTLSSNLDLLGQGSVTPMIELPDGTVNLLDPLSFSSSGSSTPFGPFNLKGKYRFSIRVEPGTTLSSEAEVCFVQVNVNGVTDEVIKIELPASPSANFTSSPVSFRLH